MRADLSAILAVLLVLPAFGAAAEKGEPPPEERQADLTRGDTRHAEIPAMFHEISPHKAKKLEWMREHRPGHFKHALRRLQRMAREMEKFQRTDLEEFRRRADLIHLEDDVERLGDEYRRAKKEKERARVKGELLEKLEELFDRKEETTRARIERMEEDIRELKGRLDKRHRNRAKIIERKFKQLTEEDDLEF